MAELKPGWYKSKKGWASAAVGLAYFILDHVSRAQTAKDIYAFLIGPARKIFPILSPFVPLVLFVLACVFFELERRKRNKGSAPIYGTQETPAAQIELLQRSQEEADSAMKAQRTLLHNMIESGRVQILSPLDQGDVGKWHVVRGSVYRPNGDVQVLVHAGDGWWYLQGQAKVEGFAWSRECKFGIDTPGSGGSYKVVAILGTPVRESRIRELPSDVPKSEEISVRRTHDGDGRIAPNSDASEYAALKKSIHRSYNLLSQEAKALLGFLRVQRIASQAEIREYFQKYELSDSDKAISDLRINSVPYLSPVSETIKLNGILEKLIAEIAREDEWEFLEAIRQTSSDGLEFRMKSESGFKGRYKALTAQTSRRLS